MDSAALKFEEMSEEGGRRIADRYELIAVLGTGGMGVVWRARDTRLGRPVAVKVLSGASLGSTVARSRLIREARAAAALEHGGIVRVYDVGETEDGGAFLVMELIRGQSFRSALQSGSLSLSRRAEVIADAARALDFAHAAGIVHRDVKPDNLMIHEDGHVTVVDFGVAKPVATELLTNAETLAGVTGPSLTGADQLVGTPAYLAPEQAKGAEVSPATDQFALAVTAHEALCGKLPWQGERLVEIVASVLRDESPPISSCAEVPADLDAVLKRALAKDPKDRFPTMAAFADAFEDAASSLPADPGPRPGARPRSATPTSLHATDAPSTVTPSPPTRRRPSARTLLAGAVSVCVLALGAWYASSVRSKREAPEPTGSASVSAATLATTIACPSFEVTGVDEPWLGAAAAALACERIQIARGGLDPATLVPAELLDAPRDVAKPGFPVDLLEGPKPRERAIAAANRRGTRWLDATLDKQASSFGVRAVLRSPEGRELARGEGRGVEMFEAVREALKPIIQANGPPSAAQAAVMRDWLDVASPEEALDLLDVRTSILIEDPVSLRESCATVARRTGLAPRVAYLTQVSCARKLRTGRVEQPPPPLDESTPGALTTTSLAQGTMGGPAGARERALRLERERDKTSMPEGQARLSAAAAELYNLVGDDHARQLARMAIRASLKAIDWRTSAWHRLAFSTDGGGSLGPALATWHPWEPIVQSLRGGTSADAQLAGQQIWRAYLLSQRGVYAHEYGERLALEGNVEAARGIAELTNDDLLKVDILLGEAKYGAALAKVPQLLSSLPPTEENAALAFRLANEGVRAALVLDRPADFVDGVVSGYVTSEPHHVIDGVVPFLSLVSSCCFAPRATGKRCVARLQQLRAEGKLPTIYNGADIVVAGAARFVSDDYAGAAKAWRTMLRSPGWIQEPLIDVMAVALERAGAPDLAEEVDAPRLALVDLPRTADLAWVRGAKRAQKRGDFARARKLASAVVEKWRFADEDIPAVREMRELLAKLPPSRD
jgi:serine/threonine protein kinase